MTQGLQTFVGMALEAGNKIYIEINKIWCVNENFATLLLSWLVLFMFRITNFCCLLSWFSVQIINKERKKYFNWNYLSIILTRTFNHCFYPLPKASAFKSSWVDVSSRNALATHLKPCIKVTVLLTYIHVILFNWLSSRNNKATQFWVHLKIEKNESARVLTIKFFQGSLDLHWKRRPSRSSKQPARYSKPIILTRTMSMKPIQNP